MTTSTMTATSRLMTTTTVTSVSMAVFTLITRRQQKSRRLVYRRL
jgi:hypothetical protein